MEATKINSMNAKQEFSEVSVKMDYLALKITVNKIFVLYLLEELAKITWIVIKNIFAKLENVLISLTLKPLMEETPKL